MSIPQADSTLIAIRKKVRRLTNSPGQSSLTDDDLDEHINVFYSQDFPYAIKIDQMKQVYTIFTRPYIDRYPVDVNNFQGFRSPAYFDGIQGSFFKDRTQFFNLWPKIPTKFQIGSETLSGTITGIAQPTNPTEITSVNHGLSTGAVVTIASVGGMTQLNGNSYTITVIDANTFSLDGIDNAAFGAYTSGGTWTAVSQTFNFTLQGPFLSGEVTIGGVDVNGNAITITDDGNGNLLYVVPNAQTSTPPLFTVPATPQIPGMHNLNLGNPGLYNPTFIGTVDYVTGEFDFTLPNGISLAQEELFNIFISQYQPGKPYNLLFWNNELHIRPVPKLTHRITIEVYQTPVQFMATSSHPILDQWHQYISYGVACEIQRERNDFASVDALMEGMKRQEALVLERQGVEEIGMPNYTLFNSTQANPYLNNFWGMGWQ